MELSNEIIYIMVSAIALAGGLGLVSFLTKSSRNFRNSRNKRARKQF